ncbi:hypothetical protein TNCV_187631 [Trichonephila clavipes]|nr:hypothetical protein TNCV_187631 [Trichonephila clavipes]
MLWGDVLQHASSENTQQLKQMLIEEWGLIPQEMLHQLVSEYAETVRKQPLQADAFVILYVHSLLSPYSEFHVSQMIFREVMVINPPVA